MVTANRGELRDHLLELELALARRDPAAAPEGLAELIDDEFLEFGASGRRWSRASMLELLTTPQQRKIRIEGFQVKLLAAGVALATFATVEHHPLRRVLRSSIWVSRGNGWRICFHQGTPTPMGRTSD